MIFLIEYNRSEGSIVTFQKFESSDRRQAEERRFSIELDLNRKGVEHEVVLLEAECEDDLRRTHRRYFETLQQILEDKPERKSRSSLANLLLARGGDMPLTEFQDLLEDLHSNLYPYWSVDELLLHPDHAKDFCDRIRRQTSLQGLPDDLILRCLISRRKNPKATLPYLAE